MSHTYGPKDKPDVQAPVRHSVRKMLHISDSNTTPTHLNSRADMLACGRAPAYQLYQNRIKTLSETAIGVVRQAKSRFPRLLERLRKRDTEWTVWKGTSRTKGRCARRSDPFVEMNIV